MAVWSTSRSYYAQFTSARGFHARDGQVRDLGGGCGGGGRATATCAAVGAAAFGLGLRHAAPASSTWLVLGTAATAVPCGGCTLLAKTSARRLERRRTDTR
ncbi:MAG: hypothetical protein AAF628_23975 [Planctomycetota bacterium]